MSEIIMFTTDAWPHCGTAKSYLREKGYKFQTKDVDKDPRAREEFTKRGLRGVPAFIIDGQLVEGLDTKKIEQLMKNKIILCPECNSKLRVPKNKGEISVKCPKCNTKFEEYTGDKK